MSRADRSSGVTIRTGRSSRPSSSSRMAARTAGRRMVETLASMPFPAPSLRVTASRTRAESRPVRASSSRRSMIGRSDRVFLFRGCDGCERRLRTAQPAIVCDYGSGALRDGGRRRGQWRPGPDRCHSTWPRPSSAERPSTSSQRWSICFKAATASGSWTAIRPASSRAVFSVAAPGAT